MPPGKYTSGPIELFSNMTLEVDAGATIEFPVAPLPFTKGRYLGVETLAPMPLIGGHDVENVTVTGRGILTTGDYEAWRKAYKDAYEEYLKARKGVVSTGGDESGSANGPHWDHLLKALEARQPVSEAEYREAAGGAAPLFCLLHECEECAGGRRAHSSARPMFVVHLLYAENATVRNVMIRDVSGPACQRHRGGFQPLCPHLRQLYRYRRRRHCPQVRKRRRRTAGESADRACHHHQLHGASRPRRGRDRQRDGRQHPQCRGQQHHRGRYRERHPASRAAAGVEA